MFCECQLFLLSKTIVSNMFCTYIYSTKCEGGWPASTHLWCCFHSWKQHLQLGIQKNWYCLHQCRLLVAAQCKNCVSCNPQVESHSTVCRLTPAAQYLPPLCNPTNQAGVLFHRIMVCVRFEVLMAPTIKTMVFCDVISYTFINGYQYFRKTCCLHMQPCICSDDH